MSDEVLATSNPIIPRRGVCDPHVKIFDDVAYLYASHDVSPDNSDYLMRDWQVWSSKDLRRWTKEASIDPADFYTGPTDTAWAIDVASRGGKCYLYFSDGNTATGVAVSDTPVGPWTDVLRRPLLDGSITGGRDYDPTVLVDTDGAAYIVVGGPEWAYPGQGGYFIARLGEDMMSLAEEPRRLEVDHPADDKPSLNRLGDHYYLTFASHVAVSESVYGPFRYLGNTGASLDHGSYFEWNGQLYNAFTIFDPSLWHRATGICYVHQREDLMLEVDSLIVEYGVHQYRAEWNKIGAEWFSSCRGGSKHESFRGKYLVAFDSPGSLCFEGVEGAEDADTLALCGASSGSGTVTVVVDGVALPPVALPLTGERYGPRFFIESLEIPGIRHSLELEVTPSAGGWVDIDWWTPHRLGS